MLDNLLKLNTKLEAVPQHHTDGHHPLETAVDSVDHQAASAVADGLEVPALAVCLAAASVLEAVPQEVLVDQVGLVVLEAVPQAAHNSQEVILDSVLEGLEAHHLPLRRHLAQVRLA